MTIFKDVPVSGIRAVACRVGGPRGIVKAFIVAADGNVVLIDTGFSDEDADRIVRALEESGHTLAQVDLCILTHSHGDHVGGLRRLVQQRALRVAAHVLDVPAIQSQTGCTVTDSLQGGETLPLCGGLQVLHLPGHSPGSIAVYCVRERALFTGDTLVSAGEHVMPPPGYLCADTEQARRSAEGLAASDLPIAHLFVAHGDDVYGTGSTNLKRILTRQRTL